MRRLIGGLRRKPRRRRELPGLKPPRTLPALALATARAYEGLGRPTPFFDEQTKAPRAVSRVLTRSERAAL
jgi:hypothetical protein